MPGAGESLRAARGARQKAADYRRRIHERKFKLDRDAALSFGGVFRGRKANGASAHVRGKRRSKSWPNLMTMELTQRNLTQNVYFIWGRMSTPAPRFWMP